MNLLKLSTIAISAAVLLGAEVAQAASPMLTPIVKRSILLSAGNAKSSAGSISRNLKNNGYTDAELTETNDLKTFAVGYRQPLGTRWSVDVTYIDQGESTGNIQAAPSGSTDPAKDIALSLPIYGNGLNYAALRHFPATRGLSAHFGAGAFIYTNEREATIDGDRHVKTDGGVSAMAQLGLSFAITRQVNIEVIGQRFFMPDGHVNRLSLDVSVGF